MSLATEVLLRFNLHSCPMYGTWERSRQLGLSSKTMFQRTNQKVPCKDGGENLQVKYCQGCRRHHDQSERPTGPKCHPVPPPANRLTQHFWLLELRQKSVLVFWSPVVCKFLTQPQEANIVTHLGSQDASISPRAQSLKERDRSQQDKHKGHPHTWQWCSTACRQRACWPDLQAVAAPLQPPAVLTKAPRKWRVSSLLCPRSPLPVSLCSHPF